MMMWIEAAKVFLFVSTLLVRPAIVCGGKNDSESAGTIVKASEAKPNATRVCDTRTCSKLEYYDKLKQKCRDFPGGGILIIMDHSTKCAHGDSGLHTFSRRDYYYVCHPEGVMIGLCPDNTVFSDTEKRCIVQTPNQPSTIRVHDEGLNCNILVPDCNGVGLFPIPSNCSFYFKCQEHNYDFYQYVYQCPAGKVFHPDLLRCSSSNKCYDGHEDILNNFNKDYFPECHIRGQFRTSKDCTLFYRCVPNIDGSFYQIRYECPCNMYYSIEDNVCMRGLHPRCDYIPHERIIEDYKLRNSLESTTVGAQPTTVISAINTKITSSMPAYYDTTQPLNVNEAQSLVQGSSESYTTTEQVPTYTTGSNLEESPSDLEYGSGNFYLTEPNEASYENTDSNGDSRIAEETPLVYDAQETDATAEGVLYDETYSVATTDIVTTAATEETRPMYVSEEPIEGSKATALATQYPDEFNQSPNAPTVTYPAENANSLPNNTSSDWPRTRFGSGYEEMVWDSGAWSLPDRTKPVAASVTANDCNETEIMKGGNDVPISSEWPDHFSVNFEPSVPYSSYDDQVGCETALYVPGTGDTEISITTEDPYSQKISTNSMQLLVTNSSYGSTTNIEYQEEESNTSVSDDEPPVVNLPALEINCTADKDGEIICNGQKLSVQGYLEILGYTIKLKKWQEIPGETSGNYQGPVINFHLCLQHPFSYVLEGYPTAHRSSFSYDYPSTTIAAPSVDVSSPQNTDTV